MSHGRLRAAVQGLALAAVSLVIALVVAEIGLRLLHPLPDPFAYLKVDPESLPRYVPSAFRPGFELKLTTEPGLPGMEPRQRTFSINNLGFRGDSLVRPKPDGEFRVFMVGGSTTECVYLDDSEAVTRVLQTELQRRAPAGIHVDVQGAGKSGDKSFDHLAMIAHRIVHLQPDAIVVFLGINDLEAAMGHRDYLMFPQTTNSGGDVHWTLGQLVRFTATEFQLPRLAYYALNPVDEEDISLTSSYAAMAERKREQPIADDPPRTDLQPFAQNLRSIVGVARANHVPIVLMTQATTWNSDVDPRAADWHWLTGFESRHREDQLDSAMELYNDTTRAVAAEFGIPILDLARALPKSLDFFYDDVHFNVNGAATAAAALADVVAPLMSPRDAPSFAALSAAPPTDVARMQQ